MSRMAQTLLAVAVIVGGFSMLAPSVQAQSGHGGPRQYYGHWSKHPTHNYHYRQLYYKPTPTFRGYKHHYVVHTPKDPKHLYFYNPYKKQYWGRCPIEYGDKPVYSILKPEHRKATLKEIPVEAFPAPGDLPPLPDATDGAILELPPDDLPNPEGPAE